MGVHHPYRLDLCADDEDPFQLIIRPGWDAPHVRCSPRTFCAWPCLLRQVGTVLGSPYDDVVARLAYTNPGSGQPRAGGCFGEPPSAKLMCRDCEKRLGGWLLRRAPESKLLCHDCEERL